MSIETELPLVLLPPRLAVCRLPSRAEFPDWVQTGEAPDGYLLALVRTPDELTIVCEERIVPPEVKAERGWRAFQVQGPLDFSLTGVLASIAAPLAQSGVSIFAVSTFDTDYILVKENVLERALQALAQSGFLVINYVRS
jgi:uncharacterized protein